jgi:hypothetical protein
MRALTASLFDDQMPDYPEATINLIDALRDYIHVTDDMMSDFAREGALTSEQVSRWKGERGALCNIVTDLESQTFEGWGPEWDFRTRLGLP